ncbi:ABC transporter permease subunit [Pseudooceanicola sp. 216_PA32_1]|uniref:ABC transporter permease subunit n=1 Tax=Pseudooceanicola pacificus TaxID=2676438 RepID=A0A844W494_9RHOB|nr:ABC transporter permease [Pseudooceanicola pacificus]MWB77631.1 ABC transporter permease subunit [Pseudooceanicola pacificus]
MNDLSRDTAYTTEPAEDHSLAPRRNPVLRAFRHRSLLAGTVICAILILLVAAAPLLTSADPNKQSPMTIFQPPSVDYPMGTDAFGRDLLARVLYGGRVSMLSSAAVVMIGAFFGTLMGLVAGYFGGRPGFVIMRVVDLLLAFPGILLALAITAILGPGLVNGIIAISIILIPVYARLVEGATTEVRALPFVDAAVTLGAGPWRIIATHIVPNVMPSIIVMTTTWLGIALLWITALGFIGLGVQPPNAEWGAILNDGQQFITLAWWMTVFPGLFLSLFVVGVNLIGDGLRDELDPKVAN